MGVAAACFDQDGTLGAAVGRRMDDRPSAGLETSVTRGGAFGPLAPFSNGAIDGARVGVARLRFDWMAAYSSKRVGPVRVRKWERKLGTVCREHGHGFIGFHKTVGTRVVSSHKAWSWSWVCAVKTGRNLQKFSESMGFAVPTGLVTN